MWHRWFLKPDFQAELKLRIQEVFVGIPDDSFCVFVDSMSMKAIVYSCCNRLTGHLEAMMVIVLKTNATK